jgi:hypothetical protein
MTWTVHNTNSTTTIVASSGNCTLAVTAGDIIVAFGASSGSGIVTSFSDNVNGAYTAAANADNDRPANISVAMKIAATTATVTITGTSSSNLDAIQVFSVANNAGTIPGTKNTSNSALSSQTVNITTTTDNCLIVGAGDASGSCDAGSGFTAIAQTLSGLRFTSEYQTALTNSAGVNTVALSEGTQRGILAVAFDPPVSTTVQTPANNRVSQFGPLLAQ